MGNAEAAPSVSDSTQAKSDQTDHDEQCTKYYRDLMQQCDACLLPVTAMRFLVSLRVLCCGLQNIVAVDIA